MAEISVFGWLVWGFLCVYFVFSITMRLLCWFGLGWGFLAFPCQSNERHSWHCHWQGWAEGRPTFTSPSPAPSCPSLSLLISARKEADLTCSFPRCTKLWGKRKHKLSGAMVLKQPRRTLKRNQGRKSSQNKVLFFNHGQILSLFLSSWHRHAAVSSKIIIPFTSKENCRRKKEILGDLETNYSIYCGSVILGESLFFRKSKECQVCGGYWGWPRSRM